MHPGVYVVGHAPLTREGRFLAAVLACGPGAVLSHRSAAALRGLRPSSRSAIDVTSPRRAGRKRAGIDVHSGATLAEADVETVDGIPCTSVARTLLDLCEVIDRRGVARACAQAEVLQLFDLRALEQVLARSHGRRGAATLRAILAEQAIGATITRSGGEEAMLALCRSAGLPAPEVNVWLPLLEGDGYEADFLWRAQRLDVESDGRDVHLTRAAFEHDRRRDWRLAVAGWRVVRFSGRQITREPGHVAATIRALLDAAPAP